MKDEEGLVPCADCDEGYVELAHGSYHTTFNREDYVVPDVDFFRCSVCGAVSFSGEQLDELQRKTAETVRRQLGMLSGDEISQLRRSLGYSQSKLEKALRCGAKTVVRWESGTVIQNRAADDRMKILRLFAQNPSLFGGLSLDELVRKMDDLAGFVSELLGCLASCSQTTGRTELNDAASGDWTALAPAALDIGEEIREFGLAA